MDIYQDENYKIHVSRWFLILTNLEKLILSSRLGDRCSFCIPLVSSPVVSAAQLCLHDVGQPWWQYLRQSLQLILVCSLISEWWGRWMRVNPEESPQSLPLPPDHITTKTAHTGLLSESWNNAASATLSCHKICTLDPGIQGSPSEIQKSRLPPYLSPPPLCSLLRKKLGFSLTNFPPFPPTTHTDTKLRSELTLRKCIELAHCFCIQNEGKSHS